MLSPPIFRGSCFCGNVSFSVTSLPLLSAYCHCTHCQRLTGCPCVHTLHFPGLSFQWTHQKVPEESLDYYDIVAKPWKRRWRCKVCGSGVASYNSKTGNWSVWAAQLARDDSGRIAHYDMLKPTAHIFYETRMLDVNDDLGKWEGYENESRRVA